VCDNWKSLISKKSYYKVSEELLGTCSVIWKKAVFSCGVPACRRTVLSEIFEVFNKLRCIIVLLFTNYLYSCWSLLISLSMNVVSCLYIYIYISCIYVLINIFFCDFFYLFSFFEIPIILIILNVFNFLWD